MGLLQPDVLERAKLGIYYMVVQFYVQISSLHLIPSSSFFSTALAASYDTCQYSQM